MDEEFAHERALDYMRWASARKTRREKYTQSHSVDDPRLSQEVFGLRFPRPLGLAAGFDKNAKAPLAAQTFGFGFAELGTVTPRKQEGNPKPRLVRYPREQALWNQMGFNNIGAASVASRIEEVWNERTVPIGVNIGKQRGTPIDRAPSDYLECMEAVARFSDFVVVNVSSPNTPELRELQHVSRFRGFLSPLTTRARRLNLKILVKIDPDLEARHIESIVTVALDLRVDGIVATNTTTQHAISQQRGNGGVSGLPLRRQSTEILRTVAGLGSGKIPVIGVGGIFSAADAYEKILAGASLLEIYTGFIYGGPATARHIHEGLVSLLERDGHAHLREAVGHDLKER